MSKKPELIEDEELEQATGGIKFTDLLVSSYSTGGSTSEGPTAPAGKLSAKSAQAQTTEDITLNFSKIEVDYSRR
ncbi:MAG: hypothetical protein AAF568_10300 [Pseudomonadota bacterium]